MDDVEKQAPRTASLAQATMQYEPFPNGDSTQDVPTGFTGEPDSDHKAVELMDSGHEKVLERQRTLESIKAGGRPADDTLKRTQTGGTAKSHKSILSRISTSLTTRNRKAQIEEIIPESDLDNGIVGWEGQDDPLMPLNFAPSRKWVLLALISSITFISPLASSMFAPGVQFMDEDFGNTSLILSSFTVSVFVLGFAVGPVFLSPLSEIFGRRPVLLAGNVIFAAWQLGCALAPNLTALIIMRFLAGVGGSGCLTIGGGVIADLFKADQRGLATSFYSFGPLMGPVVGPVIGGFISERASWRWVFWVLFIASTVFAIGIELLNRETNHRVLIRHKTRRLRKELNRPELRSCYDTTGSTPHTKGQILKTGVSRPLKMLFRSPIVFLLSLYMSVVYGLLYLLFTTITSVFQDTYHWNADICGLAYIGIGLGFMFGVAAVAKLSDQTVVKMTRANGGVFEPEMRLPACVVFACFIPVSFFWYGWSADKHTHWIVPILGLIPFGFGMMGIFIPIQTYIIDAFPAFAASGVAALTVSRSLFGGLLPLAGPKMYQSLGLGWGNSVLGFVALALIPAPALIYKFGGAIRKNHPVRL
ncbi:MAG: hypothetical protein M1818_000883 [Claussenomyces sp. TS43310]|nr:MAG: hypothetical protein M1818_000883 [Claussenomyces sp. TS43310]